MYPRVHFLRLVLAGTLLVLLASPALRAENTNGATTRWKTLEKDGVHWLVDPSGRPFYSKGVNFIDPGKDTPRSREKLAYYWANFYPSMEEWRRETTTRLQDWGFNTRGGWSDTSAQLDLPLMIDIELGRNSKFHWFDSFHPTMEQRVMEWAEKLTAPYRNDPRIVGYFSDNEVGWWNSALFKWYLSKGWDNYTKRVLWQLLVDHYEGDWDKLSADWVVQGKIEGFDALKQSDVELKLRPGGHGIKVVDRFLYLVARQYYDLMYRAIRKAHPEALVLGDRLPLYYHQDAVFAIGDNVDVISTNYNLDVPDGWVSPYYFEGLQRLTRKPVLVTEFFFAAEENRSGNLNETARNKHPKPGHLMTVQTQEERARGVASAVTRFARFPNLVGAHWFQFCDEPFGGREDGEDYNMGLIDTSNKAYEEVTRTFQQLNAQIETIHGRETAVAATQPTGFFDTPLAEAAVDSAPQVMRTQNPPSVSDQSLMDWDKDKTRIAQVQAPVPYVPFGDLHLSWTPQGLYLATIANTFVDPTFLAYEGEFPNSESFQIHVATEVDGKLHHQTVYMVPSPDPNEPDGFSVSPRLVQWKDEKTPVPVPTDGRVQRVHKSLPHMYVEAFLPAESLGVRSLKPGMELRLSIAMTNYFREFTMSWPGQISVDEVGNRDLMRPVVLKN